MREDTRPVAIDADFWAGRRVLVTGHTGFKGAWLSLWLQSLGAEVTRPRERDAHAALACTSCAGVGAGMRRAARSTCATRAAVRAALARAAPEIVLHLAAQPMVRRSLREPALTYEVNVIGTVNVLEAVRARRRARARRCVVVTSDKCYENRRAPPAPLPRGRPARRQRPLLELEGLRGAASTAAYRRSFFAAPRARRAWRPRAPGNVIGGGDWGEDRLRARQRARGRGGAAHARPQPRAPCVPGSTCSTRSRGYLLLAAGAVRSATQAARAWNFGPRAARRAPGRAGSSSGSPSCGTGALALASSTSRAHPPEAALPGARLQRRPKRELGWRRRWDLERGAGAASSSGTARTARARTCARVSLAQIERLRARASTAAASAPLRRDGADTRAPASASDMRYLRPSQVLLRSPNSSSPRNRRTLAPMSPLDAPPLPRRAAAAARVRGLRARVLARSSRARLRGERRERSTRATSRPATPAWQGLYAAVLDGEEIANPAGWLVLVTFRRAIEEHRARSPHRARSGAGRWRRRGALAGRRVERRPRGRARRSQRGCASLFEGLRARLERARARGRGALLPAGPLARRGGRADGRQRGAHAQADGGRGAGEPGRRGKVGELVRSDPRRRAGARSRRSLMRALAFGMLDPDGERYRLASRTAASAPPVAPTWSRCAASPPRCRRRCCPGPRRRRAGAAARRPRGAAALLGARQRRERRSLASLGGAAAATAPRAARAARAAAGCSPRAAAARSSPSAACSRSASAPAARRSSTACGRTRARRSTPRATCAARRRARAPLGARLRAAAPRRRRPRARRAGALQRSRSARPRARAPRVRHRAARAPGTRRSRSGCASGRVRVRTAALAQAQPPAARPVARANVPTAPRRAARSRARAASERPGEFSPG